MITIVYKKRMYVFPKNTDLSVPDKVYNERLWFIVKNIGRAPYDYVVNMSHIWANKHFYNLEYVPHIMSQLDDYIST